MCACTEKPLVVPSQHSFKIEVNRIAMTGRPVVATAANANPRVADNKEMLFDEAFILKDRRTGVALANVEYRIKFEDGTFEYGFTDAHGHTHVATTAESENLILEVRP